MYVFYNAIYYVCTQATAFFFVSYVLIAGLVLVNIVLTGMSCVCVCVCVCVCYIIHAYTMYVLYHTCIYNVYAYCIYYVYACVCYIIHAYTMYMHTVYILFMRICIRTLVVYIVVVREDVLVNMVRIFMIFKCKFD